MHPQELRCLKDDCFGIILEDDQQISTLSLISGYCNTDI